MCILFAMDAALLGTFALSAMALALASSLLSLAGTAFLMIQGRGPRMAQLRDVVVGDVQALGGRIQAAEVNLAARCDAAESTVRQVADEAAEIFGRTQRERKRVEIAANRIDLAAAVPAEEVDPDESPLRRQVREKFGP